MKYIDLSFQTPQENLACDEALLECAEESSGGEVLRFWESNDYFVVLGYSRKFHLEVNGEACRKHNIPVLRRPSGGGTVLQGPGCLNYSLILNLENGRPLQTITETNRYILNRHKKSLEPILDRIISVRGISDLALGNLKFSGNAQRRKKLFVLFHGTFLLDFKIPLIEEILTLPPAQPEYRKNRKHRDFLINLNANQKTIKQALKEAWSADEILNSIPRQKISQLIEERYAKDAWNLKY